MNAIKSVSNYMSSFVDISQYVNSPHKKVTLIVLAIFSSLAICYYVVRSCFRAQPIQQKASTQQKAPVDVLPSVTGRMGMLPHWQVTKTQNIFQSLYDFVGRQKIEKALPWTEKRVELALEAFIPLTQKYPYLNVKLYTSADLNDNYLSPGQKTAIQECLNKGCHFYSYAPLNTAFSSSSVNKELGFSTQFVDSFNDKLKQIPAAELFDNAEFRQLLLQVVDEMERAVNPTGAPKDPISTGNKETIIQETKDTRAPTHIQKKMGSTEYTVPTKILPVLIEAGCEGTKITPEIETLVQEVFITIYLFSNLSAPQSISASELFRIRSTIGKAFAPTTTQSPIIQVIVYQPDDVNHSSLTSNEKEAIEECLKTGCHFYTEKSKKVLGLSLDFLKSFHQISENAAKYDFNDQTLNKPTLQVVDEMVKAIKLARTEDSVNTVAKESVTQENKDTKSQTIDIPKKSDFNRKQSDLKIKKFWRKITPTIKGLSALTTQQRVAALDIFLTLHAFATKEPQDSNTQKIKLISKTFIALTKTPLCLQVILHTADDMNNSSLSNTDKQAIQKCLETGYYFYTTQVNGKDIKTFGFSTDFVQSFQQIKTKAMDDDDEEYQDNPELKKAVLDLVQEMGRATQGTP